MTTVEILFVGRVCSIRVSLGDERAVGDARLIEWTIQDSSLSRAMENVAAVCLVRGLSSVEKRSVAEALTSLRGSADGTRYVGSNRRF